METVDPTMDRVTVLVVDDTKENLTVIGQLLRPYYHVRVANSGARALQAVEVAPRPDLILLDVMMPDMDGYEVLKALRQQPVSHDIPVIFVTALAADTDEELGLSLGAVDYVTKPIKPALLLARVKAQLELKKARDWLADQNAYLDAEVHRRMAENELIKDVSLHALAALAEKRDNETGNHLHRTQGYVAQLRKLLLRFADDHAADMDKVRADLAQQDWVAAERRVHTLKGVAGMLGWVTLQREAQAVEQVLKQHGADVQPVLLALPQLEVLLQDALRATQALVPVPSVANRAPLDWAVLESGLTELRALLATDDLDAADAYERVAPMLVSHLPEHARALGSAVEHYDFARATEALNAMVASPAWQALQKSSAPDA